MIFGMLTKLALICVLFTCIIDYGLAHKEFLEYPTEMRIVHVGDDTQLECLITANVPENSLINIHWERPLGTIIAKGSAIILRNVQLEDSGDYICKAVEVVNSRMVIHEDETANVREQSKIKITSPIILIGGVTESHTIEMTETQSLLIGCSVSNWKYSDYRVQWIKEANNQVSRGHDLYISSLLQSADQGRYRCEVQNKADESSVYSKYIDLHITVPTLSITILPTEHLQINGRIHRKCVPFDSISSNMDRYFFKWVNDRHEVVSHNAILQIPINELSVLGEYECQYTAENSLRVYSAKTTAREFASEKQSTERYELAIFSYPSRFRINERFTLRCQITPDLKNVRYEWSKGGFPYDNVQTLIFPRFKKENADVYQCRATGITEDGVKIDLLSETVQRLSYFSNHEIELTGKPGPNIAINEGETKELHCELDGTESINGKDIEWFYNGNKLSEYELNEKRLIRFNKRLVSILVMSDVRNDNEGKYECAFLSTRREAYIIINTDTAIIAVSPQVIRVFEGEPVEFHCQVEKLKGVDNTKLTWSHRNSEEQEETTDVRRRGWTVSTPRRADHTSFIALDSAKLSDAGYVVCTAPNGMNEKGQLIVTQRHVKFNVTVTPKEVVVRHKQYFEFDCFGQKEDGTQFGKPTIKYLNGSSILNDQTFVITEISPSRIRITAPRGINVKEELHIVCSVNEKTSVINIQVQDACPPNQRFCRNGQCLEMGKFCDGRRDCDDGSDEDQNTCNECEPTALRCETVNGIAPSRQTFTVNWRCDGENDCGNNFDEMNCNGMDAKCNGMAFTCPNNVTISRAFVCDGSSDCDGQEDEIGCMSPTIIKTSSSRVKATVGQRVRLQCEAMAHPLPTIIWRYNWKCLPDMARMQVSTIKKNCRKVISTLTIENFQHGDDAIYNCEAISSQNRIMSNDFQVTIA